MWPWATWDRSTKIILAVSCTCHCSHNNTTIAYSNSEVACDKCNKQFMVIQIDGAITYVQKWIKTVLWNRVWLASDRTYSRDITVTDGHKGIDWQVVHRSSRQAAWPLSKLPFGLTQTRFHFSIHKFHHLSTFLVWLWQCGLIIQYSAFLECNFLFPASHFYLPT